MVNQTIKTAFSLYKIDYIAFLRRLAIIIIEEYMYHSNFRIDKEINVMACISKLLDISGKVVL